MILTRILRGIDHDVSYRPVDDSARARAVFKFQIPPRLRQFPQWSRLPKEIQDTIWEMTLNEPGIHQVCLQSQRRETQISWFGVPRGLNLGLVHNVNAWVAAEPAALRKPVAHVDPRVDWAVGNISNHRVVMLQMDKLRVTCQSSRNFYKSLEQRSTVLRNPDTGEILSLWPDNDVFDTDYFRVPRDLSGVGFTVDLRCALLQHIRQVAITFYPAWKTKCAPVRCPSCSRMHIDTEDRLHYPIHLYQFLARCFPALTQVWLIDCTMLPKSEEEICNAMERKRQSPGCLESQYLLPLVFITTLY